MRQADARLWRSRPNRPLLNRSHAHRMEVFDLYFASVVSWTLHPGYNKPDTPKPSLAELRELVEAMLEEREKWLSSQQR